MARSKSNRAGVGDGQPKRGKPMQPPQNRRKTKQALDPRNYEYHDDSSDGALEITNMSESVEAAQIEIDLSVEGAIKETHSLMPDNATSIHQAMVEKFTPEILAAHAEATEALTVLKNEYDQEIQLNNSEKGSGGLEGEKGVIPSAKLTKDTQKEVDQKPDDSPLLNAEALDRLMAEAVGETKVVEKDTAEVDTQKEIKPTEDLDALNLDEMFPANSVGTTETNTEQKITPEDILNKINEITFGVKFEIDSNVRKKEDSEELQNFLDGFKNASNVDDSNNLTKLQRLEVIQLVLKEFVQEQKTFDFPSFKDIYEKRLESEASKFISQEEIDAILGAAPTPTEGLVKTADSKEESITDVEKISKQDIARRIASANSFSDLQKVIVSLENYGITELKGGSKSYSIAQLSEYLTDMRWLGLMAADRITRAFGLRTKAIELWQDGLFEPMMHPSVENDLREKITQSHNLNDIYNVIYEYGGLMDVNDVNRKYSVYQLQKAIEFAQKNPSDTDRFRYITGLYGLLDKIKEILEATETPILSPEDLTKLEDETPLGGIENENDKLVPEEDLLSLEEVGAVLVEMRTLPFTDAAGKKVELKIGDKLYLIIPDDKEIETFVVEDVDSDLERYLSNGKWYEIHSDYYSDIADAEISLAQINENPNNTENQSAEENIELNSINHVAERFRLINEHIAQFTDEDKKQNQGILADLSQLTDRWLDIRQKSLSVDTSELELDIKALDEELKEVGRKMGIIINESEELRIDEFSKLQKQLEKLSPEEKEEFHWTIHNFGFKAKEEKSKYFAGVVGGFGSNKSTIGRFANALAQTYKRDAENAHRQIGLAEERRNKGSKLGIAASSGMNTVAAIGMVAKLGRTIYDVATIASGWGLVSPYRYAMMGAMGTARLTEAGKEARFSGIEAKNPNIIHRIDWETLIKNWEEYKTEFSNSGKSEDELLKDFRTLAVASDLRERLDKSKNPQEGNKMIQKMVQFDILHSINTIEKKINKIENDQKLSLDQKRQQKINTLRSYAHHIKNLEHMVDEYGKVDMLAAGLTYAETGAKAAVFGMTAETLLLSAEHLYESAMKMIASSDAVVIDGAHVSTPHTSPRPIMGVRGTVPTHSSVVANPPLVPTGNTVEINTSPSLSSNESMINTGEIPTTPTPILPETPLVHGAAPATEVVHTTSSPMEVAPTSPKNLVEEFTKNHLLYEKTGAEITGGENGIKVVYEIGGDKGDFATLDQALRRVVAQEISIGDSGKFDAIEATRAENVLANLRQLLEGKAVGDIKPDDLHDIAEFKDGKLTILNYQKFDEFSDKLFTHAAEKISEANIDTGYNQTSTEKWQQMFDQRSIKASVDLNLDSHSATPEAVTPSVNPIEQTPHTEVPTVTPAEVTDPTEKLIDANAITETLKIQAAGSGVSSSGVETIVPPRPLQEVVVDATPYPVEYMRDVLDKMAPDQASALAEAMTEAKINVDKWEGVNFIIEGNTSLLQNADGKFDPNQIELALELSKVQYPKPAELRLALEAMKVLNLEEAQEAAIVKAITNPKEGAKALEKLFGDSSSNRGAKVTLNPRKGILHFENLGPQKLDGNMNFREGVLRIGKRAGAIFGGKFPLKNLVQAINSFK